MTIGKLLSNARALKSMMDGELQREAFEMMKEEIIESQRVQLLEGKASSGKDLRPYYSEDLKPRGYFHTKESAGRYAAWKGSLSYPVSVQRNADAPNLYITGVFHSDLSVGFGTEKIHILPETNYAAGIMAKYGVENFGLTDERWSVVIRRDGGVADTLITKMREVLCS